MGSVNPGHANEDSTAGSRLLHLQRRGGANGSFLRWKTTDLFFLKLARQAKDLMASHRKVARDTEVFDVRGVSGKEECGRR